MGPTFTFDLEQHRSDGLIRYAKVADLTLDALAELGVSATFFVVGDVAAESPELVRRIADAGHEIACHDLVHEAWHRRTPERLQQDLTRARELLEDIVGGQVLGVRAPFFSLTARTPWAPDVISASGFSYSSSVLPAANPISGFPGAPRRPYRWPTGLLELPVPVFGRGALALPILGGFYLRFTPMSLVSRLIDEPGGQALWTYVHAYDLDAEEPRSSVHGSGRLLTLLLSLGRRRMSARLFGMFGGGVAAGTLAARVASGEFEGASPSVST